MTVGDSAPEVRLAPRAGTDVALVTRSIVPEGLEYGQYKPYLRRDFVYSCAYCTMSEAEATAIRMTIDHYESLQARPDLKDVYSNLMYACDECNQRKGDRSPPSIARQRGLRFFRPDEDLYQDHFSLNGTQLEGKTATGEFSISALDLNRATLERLRSLRARLTECNTFVCEGILALRRYHIDQLPVHIKAQAARAIYNAIRACEIIQDDIDKVLESYARSPLSGEDDAERERIAAAERSAKLRGWEGLFPGQWRAPRKTGRSASPGKRRGKA